MKATIAVTERSGPCGKDFHAGEVFVLQNEESICRFCPNVGTVQDLRDAISAALAQGKKREWAYTCRDGTIILAVSVEPD